MLRISIDPQKIGGYPFDFMEDPIIHLGRGYSVQIICYDALAKDVMIVIIFIYKLPSTLSMEHISVETNVISIQ